MNRNRKTRSILICVLVAAGILLIISRGAKADFVFGESENSEPPINTPYNDGTTYISPDGLELYFTSDRAGGSGGYDIWVTTRASISESLGEPVNLGSIVNGNHYDASPSISADGRILFFSSNRPGGIEDSWDLWMATRPTEDDEWDTVVNLGPTVNDSFNDRSWESVNLPHDWAIKGPFYKGWNAEVGGGMGRLPSPGVAWYRKKLDIPESDAGKCIFLDVDGAMSYAMVWLNGKLVGGWPYGYASWRVELTPYIVPGGENQLAIRIGFQQPRRLSFPHSR